MQKISFEDLLKDANWISASEAEDFIGSHTSLENKSTFMREVELFIARKAEQATYFPPASIRARTLVGLLLLLAPIAMVFVFISARIPDTLVGILMVAIPLWALMPCICVSHPRHGERILYWLTKVVSFTGALLIALLPLAVEQARSGHITPGLRYACEVLVLAGATTLLPMLLAFLQMRKWNKAKDSQRRWRIMHSMLLASRCWGYK